MEYSTDKLQEISKHFKTIHCKHFDLLQLLFSFQQNLNQDAAIEYTKHGVSRRLNIITRCILNIFSIFPPDRNTLLTKEELADIDINLHAFFINISGIFDNLGWIFAYECNLLGSREEGKLSRHDIGLFNKKTQKYLTTKFREYLNTDAMTTWYKNYSKDYRDSLSHRIPLYLPPATLDESQAKEFENINKLLEDVNPLDDRDEYFSLLDRQGNLGNPSLIITHAIDEAKLVAFHGQILSDYLTIEEVITKFCEMEMEMEMKQTKP